MTKINPATNPTSADTANQTQKLNPSSKISLWQTEPTEQHKVARDHANDELGQGVELDSAIDEDEDREFGQKHDELIHANIDVVIVSDEEGVRGSERVEIDHQDRHDREFENTLRVLHQRIVLAESEDFWRLLAPEGPILPRKLLGVRWSLADSFSIISSKSNSTSMKSSSPLEPREG